MFAPNIPLHSLWSRVLKKVKKTKKIFKYAALNMIRTNATKERRQIFSVATADTYLIFDIYLIPLPVGLPEGVENNHLIKLNQQNGPPQNHHTTCTHTHIHTTHIHIHTSHYTYNLSQLTETPTKQTMTKRLFWPKPWHYYHLFKCLEEFLNLLIHECDIFWVLDLNRRSHIHGDLFSSYFLSAISLEKDQFWVIVKRTASITWC